MDYSVLDLAEVCNSGIAKKTDIKRAVEMIDKLCNSENINYSQFLIGASKRGCLKLVEILIKLGADINYWHHNGRFRTNALAYAASNNNFKMMQILIDAGCDVNSCSDDGINVLLYVVNIGSLKTIKFLVNAGCNVHDDKARRAIATAIYYNKYNIFKFLVKRHNIDNQYYDYHNYRLTFLMYASSLDRTKMVKYLIKLGCDINLQNNFGFTALMHARNESMKILLNAGADIYLKSNDGYSVLKTDMVKEWLYSCRVAMIMGINSLKSNPQFSIWDDNLFSVIFS